MLLLNPDESKPPPAPLGGAGRLSQAQLIVQVTTHEILHQWFGDTVTMRDWDQEYLNEGFARLMQSYGCDDLVPAWSVCETRAAGIIPTTTRVADTRAPSPLRRTGTCSV